MACGDLKTDPSVRLINNLSTIYERHGVREYWLIHPIDRVLTVYTLVDAEYGKPEIYELRGETQLWLA